MSDDKPEKIDPRFVDPATFITMPKHSVGRPSKYDPTWCEAVIKYGAMGYSRTQLAAYLDISKQTMAKYEQEQPEFMSATTRANELSMGWWEAAGRQGMFMPGFSANAYSLQMRNRFRGEYTDETETKHKVDDSVVGMMARINGRSRIQND